MVSEQQGLRADIRYDLPDAVAGILGGFMSIAITNMKLRLTAQDDFVFAQVLGATSVVISSSRKEVDILFPVLRHDERRELLVEYTRGDVSKIVKTNGSSSSMHSAGSSIQEDSAYDRGLAEVPVFEIDCSFHDPEVGRSAARLANPVLLTMAVVPPSSAPPPGDHRVARRRMETLGSDMFSRSLLIIHSKNTSGSTTTNGNGSGDQPNGMLKNFDHAQRVLMETSRVIQETMNRLTPKPTVTDNGLPLSRREAAKNHSRAGFKATMKDVDRFREGLAEYSTEQFTMRDRNFAAQQANILRLQQSWTTRTETEQRFITPDVLNLIQANHEYRSLHPI